MTLLTKRTAYKPFKYPWAFEAYDTQQKIHWLPDEVPMREDVRDWNLRLTDAEKLFLTQLFRFFTQADIDVAGGYINHWMPLFGGNPEVAQMLLSFGNMEAVHIHAYSTLIDTLGLSEGEYGAFMKYKEMKDKHDYLKNVEGAGGYGMAYTYNQHTSEWDIPDPEQLENIAVGLATYAAFTEGLQLFSSFAMLMNFQRFGKMKGMGQIVTWSIRDESLHVESMIRLFREFIHENPTVWTDETKGKIYEACRKMVDLEDAFIDLAFATGGIEGLTKEEVKEYVRYIADRRLLQLGLKANYGVKDSPLPWLNQLLNGVEHTNFFENRVTEYSKSSTTGDWDEVFTFV